MDSKTPQIGQRIRTIRKARGLTQKELAQRVGIEQPSLSDIESGKTAPRPTTLRLLAKELADDLGDRELRHYLDRRPKNPAMELVEEVASFLGDNMSVVQMFVARLAVRNELFGRMLAPGVRKNIRRWLAEFPTLVDAFDPSVDVSRKDLSRALAAADPSEADIEYGTIDEFLADSIRRHDDPELVLQDLWRREGKPEEDWTGYDAKGWERMTLEEKIDDIKEFRESLKLLDEIDEILPPNDSEPS